MPSNDDLSSLLGTPELGPAIAPAPASPVAQTAPTPATTTADTGIPRGLRNNNPLNLTPLRGGWAGQTGTDGDFAQFGSMSDGWNAAEQNLIAKVREHGLGTLSGIIGDPNYGWDSKNAPAYVGSVSRSLGVAGDQDIGQRILTDPDFRHQVLQTMAGVEVGRPMTYGGDGGTPPAQGASAPADLAGMILTPQERAQWDATGQPQQATFTDPKTGDPIKIDPAQAQSDAVKFLTMHGIYDEGAPVGSEAHPAGQQAGEQPPADQAYWYITPQGQLRQTGDDTPDYIPKYRQSFAERGNPLQQAFTGHAQALGWDQAASLNKLTGGGAPVANSYMSDNDALSPENASTPGALSDQQMAVRSSQYFDQQQRAYHLSEIGSPYAQAGRFTGQAVPALASAAAVPEIEAPAALGAFGRVAAPAVTNALRGVAATAPSVGPNPAPVGQQFATGALAGAIVPPVLDAVAGKVVSALTGKTVAPEIAQLADTATGKYSIPLRAGQISGVANETDRYADNALLNSSSRIQANNAAQRGAWMKGVTGTYGDASGDVSPEALQAAKDRIGGTMNDIAARTSITDPDAVQVSIGNIINDAQKVLPDNEVAPLLKLAENIGSVRQGNAISGDAYQALTRSGAPLDRLSQSADPNVAHYAGLIRNALDDGLQASAAPADTAALQNARRQYKNLQTVARIAPKADATGNISPALLRGAVSTNFKNQAFQGAGDLGELAQIGQTFLKEPPQSGTVPRARAVLGPLGLAALGGGEGAAALAALFHNPSLGIELGAGTMAAAAGTGALRRASQAVAEHRLGPGAAPALIQRSLPSAPRPVTSALSGLANLARPIQVPLSALSAARIPPIGSPVPSAPIGPAVGANAP